MSGSAALASTALTDAERVDVRRFCGYPAYGGVNQNGFQSWRFFTAYGTLEFRLTNLAASEFQIVRQYLASLYTLELAIPGAGANLDTDQAAVWKHNRSEVADRSALFDQWRRRLCAFLGLPPGPELGASGAIII